MSDQGDASDGSSGVAPSVDDGDHDSRDDNFHSRDVVDNPQEVVGPGEEVRPPTGYPEGPLAFGAPWDAFNDGEWRAFAGRVFGFDSLPEPMALRRLDTNIQAVPDASRTPSPEAEAEAHPRRRRMLVLLDGSSEASTVSIDSFSDLEESSDDEQPREHVVQLVETGGATSANRYRRIMDWTGHYSQDFEVFADGNIQNDTDCSSSLGWSDLFSTDDEADDSQAEVEEEDFGLDLLFETAPGPRSSSDPIMGSDSLCPPDFHDAHAPSSVAEHEELLRTHRARVEWTASFHSGRSFGDDAGASGSRRNDVSDFRATSYGETSAQGFEREGRLRALRARAAFDNALGSNLQVQLVRIPDIPRASPLFGDVQALLQSATDVPQDTKGKGKEVPQKGKGKAVPENAGLRSGPAQSPGFVADSGPVAPVPEIVGTSEDMQVLEAADDLLSGNEGGTLIQNGPPSRAYFDWRTDIPRNLSDDDEMLLGDFQRRAEPWPPRAQEHDAPYYSEEEIGDAWTSGGDRYRHISDSWPEQLESSDDDFRNVPSGTSNLIADPSATTATTEHPFLTTTRAMSIWTTPLSEPDDWASTLALIPAQLDLPAGARWHEHPRVSRYAHRRLNAPPPRTAAAPTPAPTSPPPSGYKRRQKRRVCYPRLRRSVKEEEEDKPLPWEQARVVIEACITQHYQGAFPVTLAEFARVQEYLDAGGRGREPLRREQGWHDSEQWRSSWRNQIIFEDVREMVESWGDECEGLVRYRDLARLVFAKETPAELEREEMEGYTGDSEDEGGIDGGPFGWLQEKHYAIIPRTSEEREQRSPWPFREELPDPELGYVNEDEDCGDCGCTMCIRLRTTGLQLTETALTTDLEHEEGCEKCKCKQCKQVKHKQAESAHADYLETHGGQLFE
jgi:hypothetical protein